MKKGKAFSPRNKALINVSGLKGVRRSSSAAGTIGIGVGNSC